MAGDIFFGGSVVCVVGSLGGSVVCVVGSLGGSVVCVGSLGGSVVCVVGSLGGSVVCVVGSLGGSVVCVVRSLGGSVVCVGSLGGSVVCVVGSLGGSVVCVGSFVDGVAGVRSFGDGVAGVRSFGGGVVGVRSLGDGVAGVGSFGGGVACREGRFCGVREGPAAGLDGSSLRLLFLALLTGRFSSFSFSCASFNLSHSVLLSTCPGFSLYHFLFLPPSFFSPFSAPAPTYSPFRYASLSCKLSANRMVAVAAGGDAATGVAGGGEEAALADVEDEVSLLNLMPMCSTAHCSSKEQEATTSMTHRVALSP